MPKNVKRAKDLTRDELVEIVDKLHLMMYLDDGVEGEEQWDPDQPWDHLAENIGNVIAPMMMLFGMIPDDVTPAVLE